MVAEPRKRSAQVPVPSASGATINFVAGDQANGRLWTGTPDTPVSSATTGHLA
jgi:hypothetical protein